MDKYLAWVTIPDDMEVPEPYKKFRYPGGLYASCREDSVIGEWLDNNDKYDWHGDGLRAIGWEYFNPFNIHGLPDYDYENDWACSYTTKLMPVREFMSDDEKKRINSALDTIIPRGEPIEIDLKSMTLEKKDEAICELNYSNGLLELKHNDEKGYGEMTTPQQFNAPIKIELRAKMDKARLHFRCGEIYFNLWDNEIKIVDKISDDFKTSKKSGGMVADQFVDLELFLGGENVALRVDGDLRHYSSDYGYIKALKEKSEYCFGALHFAAFEGMTITVQSLRVTEI